MPREDPERVPFTVGHNLVRFRNDKDWTQAQAAKRLGVSVRHLQRLEKGWNMTIRTAAKLASKYGRRTQDLFESPKTKLQRQPGRPRKTTVEAAREAARKSHEARAWMKEHWYESGKLRPRPKKPKRAEPPP